MLHTIETSIEPTPNDLCHEAFIRKMQLQYFDVIEDSKDEDWAYIPTGVISHKISVVPRQKIVHNNDTKEIVVTKDRHVRVHTCWRNGETSWVSADVLKEQNPWTIVNYGLRKGLTNHPDFH